MRGKSKMYFISCITQKDEFDIRTFGYFNNIEICIKALHENWCDMHEGYYDYAVIECINEGIHPKIDSYLWFKWNEEKNGFYECEDQKHEIHKHKYAYALG